MKSYIHVYIYIQSFDHIAMILTQDNLIIITLCLYHGVHTYFISILSAFIHIVEIHVDKKHIGLVARMSVSGYRG